MRHVDSHNVSDHQKPTRESQKVPAMRRASSGSDEDNQKKNALSSAERPSAAFSTPSSPRYDPGRPVHLRDEISTHRYQKDVVGSRLNLPQSPKISHDLRPISINLPTIFPEIDPEPQLF